MGPTHHLEWAGLDMPYFLQMKLQSIKGESAVVSFFSCKKSAPFKIVEMAVVFLF